MRHRKAGRRLGRNSSHRKAMLRSLVTSLLLHERVTTTLANAREAQRLADRLITLGKSGQLAARRRAFAVVADRTVVRRLFTEIAPRLNGHRGGYTRILRLRRRTGDNAELALLELTRMAPIVPAAPSKRKKAEPEIAGPARRPGKPAKGVPEAMEARPAEKAPQPVKASEPERPPAREPSPAAPAAEVDASQEPSAPPSKKGFLDGLRKFFKKK